ncbi:unnamed protein product, partial [Mesorhabditis spiculigera]
MFYPLLSALKKRFTMGLAAHFQVPKPANRQIDETEGAAAISPLIFEFIPLLATIFGGIIAVKLGLSMSEAAYFIPILVVCYPAADALMVLFGFTAYRKRLLKIIGFRQYSSAVHAQTASENYR